MTLETYMKEVYPRYFEKLTREQLMDLAITAITSDECALGCYVDPVERQVNFTESGYGAQVDLYMLLVALKAVYKKLEAENQDPGTLAKTLNVIACGLVEKEEANE